MMPINEQMTAIQRSVQEVAIMGVDSIWVVVKGEIGPLLKEMVGEVIVDPMSLTRLADFKRHGYRMKSEANLVGSLKMIPIYFIPLHWTERGSDSNKEFVLWSIIYGAYVARNMSRKITSWSKITRFYVSSPFSTYSVSDLLQSKKEENWERVRKKMRHPKRLFYLRHGEDSFLTGKLLGFTFGESQYTDLYRIIHQSPTLDDAAAAIRDSYDDALSWKVGSFHDIDSWDGYLNYMSFLKENKENHSLIHQHHDFSGLRVGRMNWGRGAQELDRALIERFFEERETE
jgi:hypothetical protein